MNMGFKTDAPERQDELRHLTDIEQSAVAEFVREMEENVIPEIVRVWEDREEVWQKRYGTRR